MHINKYSPQKRLTNRKNSMVGGESRFIVSYAREAVENSVLDKIKHSLYYKYVSTNRKGKNE